MNKRVLLIILGCLQAVYAQQDTLINYNLASRQIYDYALAVIDSSRDSDHTEWNYGSNSEFVLLNTEPPDSTCNGSGFSSLIPAQTLFPVDQYPIRTAVVLFKEINGVLLQQCSGMLVSSRYVLTDCHCIGTRDINNELRLEFFDEMMAFPAFDNGTPNWDYGGSRAIEFITFKSNLGMPIGSHDIALIKLEKAIGANTGWVGIGFNNDNSFFEENVFHEFSYPGLEGDSLYNGDTLFYSYGSMNDFSDPWIGYSGMGVPGQSGSSLLYSNNEVYYSCGTFVWGNTWHFRITPEVFYSFKAILTSDPSEIAADGLQLSGYALSGAYPNPFNSMTIISYSIPTDDHVTIRIFDLNGCERDVLVDEPMRAGTHEIRLTLNNYPSGVYIYQLYSGQYQASKRLVLLK